MISSETEVPMNRTDSHSFSTHHRRPGRSVGLAFAFVGLIAVSVLPRYSTGGRRPFVSTAAQIAPQAEGFNVTPTLDSEHAVTQVIPIGGGSRRGS